MVTFTLSPSKEAFDRAHLHVVIMLLDARAHLDLFDLDDLLLLLGFVLALLRFVFELAVIEDLADRGDGGGRNLNEVEAGFGRHVEGFAGGNHPIHLAIFLDEAHFTHADLVIDAGALVLGGRGFLGREPSYGLLLSWCASGLAGNCLLEGNAPADVPIDGCMQVIMPTIAATLQDGPAAAGCL